MSKSLFHSNRLLAGLFLLLVVSLPLLSASSFDLWVQDSLYRHGAWLIDRHDRLLKILFYDGVKGLYLLLVLGVFLAWLTSLFRNRLKPWRLRLAIVALTLVLGPLTVGVVKRYSDIPCPRQLERYGGKLPHITILQRVRGDAPVTGSQCYPAGHASGGFSLMALLFLFNSARARRRVVASALALGWITGAYKMAIGDHFFSHTWITMLWVSLLMLLIARVVCTLRRQNLSHLLDKTGEVAQTG